MGRTMKSLTTVAASAALLLGMAGAAPATPGEHSQGPTGMHRGSTECFNWSYKDGTATETIYFHNTCHHAAQIHVWWAQGGGRDVLHAPKVKAGDKGHVRESGEIKSVD